MTTASRKTIRHVALAILLATAPAAHAQDGSEAERAAIAEQIIMETVSGQMVENMADSIWPALEAQLSARNPDISRETLDDLQAIMLEQQQLLFSEVIVDMPMIYARYFSKEELEEILAFVTSPTGRKMTETQPKIMGEMMPKLMQGMMRMEPQIMEKLREAARERGLEL